jgi:phosphoribosylanthranilate isomerase
MGKTRVKICGITTGQDAAACQALGVDYLGVIFAESPRRVTPEQALEIRRVVPGASLVGVFADADLGSVEEAARLSGLNAIQLHGRETPAYCRELLCRMGLPIIKALRLEDVAAPGTLASYDIASFFLFDLDKRNSKKNGGTASLWAEAARVGRESRRVFLAGGLRPSNVREAVEQTAAFCVDVCRGVEREPGVKDPDAVLRLMAEIGR